MSIADKLVYLDGTKTALADAINIALAARGEAPLDANATFRSYAERLFYPGFLFGQGEQGGYSLPPNPDSYFADTAGTTPAALTDAIALVQGEVGPDWTQGTATARPVWAREPEGGRRNLLTYSEDFSNAVWSKGGVIVTLDSPSPIGDAYRVETTSAIINRNFSQLITAPLLKIGSQYVARILFKQGNTAKSSIRFFDDPNAAATITWANTSGLVDVGDGFFQLDIPATNYAGTGTFRFHIYPSGVGESVSVGDYVIASCPQVEIGTTPTDYQKVVTAADVTEAGVPDVPYVRFDLADDVLTTTLPAATYTVVLPTRQGIWFDSVTHAGGSFSIGPTSYTGGPAGILTALESDGVSKLVAMPYVGREPTAGEKAALVQWYQSRGAGPELEVLP